MDIPYGYANRISFDSSGGGSGSDGATFFPAVSEEGIISWTNDGGYENPNPVDIKGSDGENGFSPIITEEEEDTGYKITITDAEGTDEIHLLNGSQGQDGVTPDIVMEVNVDSSTGTPDVDVVRTGTAQQPVFNLSFSGLKGETGSDGVTPEITATANVTSSTDDPSVEVTKSGTDEQPNFDFAFSGLKGVKGDTGRTPDISMEVSVDDTSGTPICTVSRSGDIASPTYNLAFTGLKGYKGDAGSDGTDGTDGFTPTITTTPNDDGYDLTITNKTGSNTISIYNGEDGTVGTTPDISATATVDDNVGTPSVSVTKSGEILTPNFQFDFKNIKGETGNDGVTPDITMSASVSASTGTPAVSVSKSGTLSNPNYALSFSGLKGEQGQAGNDGYTPTITTAPNDDGYDITITNETGSNTISIYNGEDGTVGTTPTITADATVDSNVGNPSVTVTKTGEILTPNFTFDFKNIKGKPGTDGVSPTITETQTSTGYNITIADKTGSNTISLHNGDDGVTPNITATASVTQTTGTAAVTVTKTGATSNPNFAFAFSNIKGEQGEQGEKGDQGIQGEQGLQGVAGSDGITYTPQIGTITTVDAFEDASASVTVDSDAKTATFDFSIPKGEKGESGASGVNILQYTMTVSGWSSNVYSFESRFPFANYNLEIEPDGDTITAAQLKAWNEGQMVGSYSTNSCIAMGTVPTVNIPIILKVSSKES